LFVHQILLLNVEGVVVEQVFSPIFYMSIRSEDIRNQCRKLLEIAPNCGRFFALSNFRVGPSRNCTHVITPPTQHVDWKKFRGDTPTSPEVIEAHTLNFRANFKSLQFKFGGWPFGGVR